MSVIVMMGTAWHTLHTVAAPVTPGDLVARLRVVLKAKSDDQLAQILGVPLRTLSAYKKGQEMQFTRAVELLDLAGWLNLNEDESASARLARAQLLTTRMADNLERLVAALEAA